MVLAMPGQRGLWSASSLNQAQAPAQSQREPCVSGRSELRSGLGLQALEQRLQQDSSRALLDQAREAMLHATAAVSSFRPQASSSPCHSVSPGPAEAQVGSRSLRLLGKLGSPMHEPGSPFGYPGSDGEAGGASSPLGASPVRGGGQSPFARSAHSGFSPMRGVPSHREGLSPMRGVPTHREAGSPMAERSGSPDSRRVGATIDSIPMVRGINDLGDRMERWLKKEFAAFRHEVQQTMEETQQKILKENVDVKAELERTVWELRQTDKEVDQRLGRHDESLRQVRRDLETERLVRAEAQKELNRTLLQDIESSGRSLREELAQQKEQLEGAAAFLQDRLTRAEASRVADHACLRCELDRVHQSDKVLTKQQLSVVHDECKAFESALALRLSQELEALQGSFEGLEQRVLHLRSGMEDKVSKVEQDAAKLAQESRQQLDGLHAELRLERDAWREPLICLNDLESRLAGVDSRTDEQLGNFAIRIEELQGSFADLQSEHSSDRMCSKAATDGLETRLAAGPECEEDSAADVMSMVERVRKEDADGRQRLLEELEALRSDTARRTASCEAVSRGAGSRAEAECSELRKELDSHRKRMDDLENQLQVAPGGGGGAHAEATNVEELLRDREMDRKRLEDIERRLQAVNAGEEHVKALEIHKEEARKALATHRDEHTKALDRHRLALDSHRQEITAMLEAQQAAAARNFDDQARALDVHKRTTMAELDSQRAEIATSRKNTAAALENQKAETMNSLDTQKQAFEASVFSLREESMLALNSQKQALDDHKQQTASALQAQTPAMPQSLDDQSQALDSLTAALESHVAEVSRSLDAQAQALEAYRREAAVALETQRTETKNNLKALDVAVSMLREESIGHQQTSDDHQKEMTTAALQAHKEDIMAAMNKYVAEVVEAHAEEVAAALDSQKAEAMENLKEMAAALETQMSVTTQKRHDQADALEAHKNSLTAALDSHIAEVARNSDVHMQAFHAHREETAADLENQKNETTKLMNAQRQSLEASVFSLKEYLDNQMHEIAAALDAQKHASCSSSEDKAADSLRKQTTVELEVHRAETTQKLETWKREVDALISMIKDETSKALDSQRRAFEDFTKERAAATKSLDAQLQAMDVQQQEALDQHKKQAVASIEAERTAMAKSLESHMQSLNALREEMTAALKSQTAETTKVLEAQSVAATTMQLEQRIGNLEATGNATSSELARRLAALETPGESASSELARRLAALETAGEAFGILGIRVRELGSDGESFDHRLSLLEERMADSAAAQMRCLSEQFQEAMDSRSQPETSPERVHSLVQAHLAALEGALGDCRLALSSLQSTPRLLGSTPRILCTPRELPEVPESPELAKEVILIEAKEEEQEEINNRREEDTEKDGNQGENDRERLPLNTSGEEIEKEDEANGSREKDARADKKSEEAELQKALWNGMDRDDGADDSMEENSEGLPLEVSNEGKLASQPPSMGLETSIRSQVDDGA
eukprot:TRINITY_DN13591_c0_g2_i1.p1 TRINITY_DN13591_c0_g2~~TRINITY_DN13591_c0_g2_i1.p1  ORF type:complete len:1486 (-),score=416.95 TRINITY_DN13591_c0_g2_i1:160-4617(-)